MWNGGQQPNKRRAVGAYPMVEDDNFWVERPFCRTAHRLPLFLSSATLLIFSSSFLSIFIYPHLIVQSPCWVSSHGGSLLNLTLSSQFESFLSILVTTGSSSRFLLCTSYHHPLYPPILIFPVYAQHGFDHVLRIYRMEGST
ncbi:uncharacterized protein ASPGLDRAFT_1414964 [Aspergillus glaucus CBS 516.65]|uniref:Transmembrane protein n=1 Tax=Aspergillus glaucus CBS 516.65 TaxID=1160497 RepID=A0A1L9VMG7_ASPGL|nr:hypothetical protein ASPGLDRAFT_1414964 [Aspergillus glaucus CBS 516.65]OJJ85070.1 hypothetical protein ASPGLDRAFT_1414964 [Aspergillus glaucus CBS 516.65]